MYTGETLHKSLLHKSLLIKSFHLGTRATDVVCLYQNQHGNERPHDECHTKIGQVGRPGRQFHCFRCIPRDIRERYACWCGLHIKMCEQHTTQDADTPLWSLHHEWCRRAIASLYQGDIPWRHSYVHTWRITPTTLRRGETAWWLGTTDDTGILKGNGDQ